MERVFVVQFRSFAILFLASELWNPGKIKDLYDACVILHNQIVEGRISNHCGDGAGGLSAKFIEEMDDSDIIFKYPLSYEIPSISLASDDIKVKLYHRKLTATLIEHIWSSHGVNN